MGYPDVSGVGPSPKVTTTEEPQNVKLNVKRGGVADTPSTITVSADTVSDGLSRFFEAIGTRLEKIFKAIYKCCFKHEMTISVNKINSKKAPEEEREEPVALEKEDAPPGA